MLPETLPPPPRGSGTPSPEEAQQSRSLGRTGLGGLLGFAWRRLREVQLPQVAGSLTFTTTLALVPLLTIVLAIFTMFPAFGQLRAELDSWFVRGLMPAGIARTISANLNQFASKAEGLSLVGAALLLVTTTTMMATIERAFNGIWGVRRPRPWSQRIPVYWALITLGPVLFGLSLSATTQLFTATGGLGRPAPFVEALFLTVLSVALTTGAYTLLYMAVPNRKVAWRDAAWGGLAAALAFELAKRLFALYITRFPTYAIIYGALAALPLFLIWVYVSWMITLAGAVLAAALPVVKHERWWQEPAPGAAFVDAVAVLKVLAGCARLTGSALVTSASIRTHTRIGYDEMSMLLEKMAAAGWVGRVQDDAPVRLRWRHAREGADAWVLLVDPGSIRLADVYRLFVFDPASMDGTAPATPLALDSAALARQVEAAVEDGLGQTLAEHFGRP